MMMMMKVIKSVIDYICKPLSHIFNVSLLTGCFPEQMKASKVIPLFKSDDKKLVNNYRPVSVLPVFSKILEKIIYNRLINHFDTHCLLNSNQFGFRSNYSTSMAVLQLLDKISTELDSKNYSVGIFMDLSKAFDTINHQILLDKLAYYGIRGVAYELIKSYLTHRSQYVFVNSVISECLPITCGVPQGSVLGPLLFIVYINDICNVTSLFDIILFADDTNIFKSGNNIRTLISDLNLELIKIARWFKLNRLSLNLKKTKYIIFCNKYQRKFIPNDVVLKIDDTLIERVGSTKFLGIIINEKITWHDHIQAIKDKISKGIGIICRLRRVLPIRLLIVNLYYAFVHPFLDYGNIVWGTAPKTIINKILLMQKKVVRIILNCNRTDHAAPLLKRFRILNVFEINTFQTACFMYRIEHKSVPPVFLEMFCHNRDVHNYFTRHYDDFYVSFSRTNVRKHTIAVHGTKVWNKVPLTIKYSHNLLSFKCQFKRYLL